MRSCKLINLLVLLLNLEYAMVNDLKAVLLHNWRPAAENSLSSPAAKYLRGSVIDTNAADDAVVDENDQFVWNFVC